MLEIQALTYNDLAPVVPIAGVLPEEGGTIGRGPQNAIVLPDPMRLVSRQHLNIVPEANGQYRLVNISGANLVYVNSEELPSGMGFMIHPGDKIYVGGYVLLLVQRDANSNSAAPVGAGTAAPTQADPLGLADAASPAASAKPAADSGQMDDFLSVLFADTPDARKTQGLSHSAAIHSKQTSQGDDVLELLMQGTTARQQDPMQSLTRDGVDLHSFTGKGDGLINSHDGTDHSLELVKEHGGGRIDELMGGKSVDPLALFGDVSSDGDVLASLGQTSGVAHGSRVEPLSASINHGSELGGLFQTPELSVAAPHPSDAPLAPAAQLPDDFDAFLSPVEPTAEPTPELEPSAAPLNMATRDSPTLVVQPPAPQSEGQDPLQQVRPMSLDDLLGPELASEDPLAALLAEPEELAPVTHKQLVKASPVQPPVQPPQAFAAAPAPAGTTAAQLTQDTQLYEALLKGLGLTEIPDRNQLDANFMYLIGQLLRCTSQGTVDLMAGRAVVKREVKANVTMIAPERNNPMKFSPDGEVALMYLLGRTYPGFMQPAEAMSNAYLDLRAHQIGLVSGMRSALGHVLDKFDPSNIDNDTIEAGLLGGFGNGRKAKLWDAYGRYYQATRDEAEDRFQEFFGAAFLKAYEEATESLKLSERPPENEWGAQ